MLPTSAGDSCWQQQRSDIQIMFPVKKYDLQSYVKDKKQENRRMEPKNLELEYRLREHSVKTRLVLWVTDIYFYPLLVTSLPGVKLSRGMVMMTSSR